MKSEETYPCNESDVLRGPQIFSGSFSLKTAHVLHGGDRSKITISFLTLIIKETETKQSFKIKFKDNTRNKTRMHTIQIIGEAESN